MKELETSGGENEKSQGVCWSFCFSALQSLWYFCYDTSEFFCQNAFFKSTAGFLFSDFHGQIQTHLQKITAIFSSTPGWTYSITIVASVFRPAFSLISVPSFLPLGRTKFVRALLPCCFRPEFFTARYSQGYNTALPHTAAPAACCSLRAQLVQPRAAAQPCSCCPGGCWCWVRSCYSPLWRSIRGSGYFLSVSLLITFPDTGS